jgi:uncharacterized membrane protein
MKKRQLWLDYLRGMAVIWMIIFHFTYDLTLFRLISVDMDHGFWFFFPRLIAGTFLFCVGAALEYAHSSREPFSALYPRLKKLGICALLVSLSTFLIFRSQWIYFGTLHCIWFSTVVGFFFIGKRNLQFLVMSLILFFQWGLNFDIKWLSKLINRPSLDFIPVYPWFSLVLLGMLIAPKIKWKEFDFGMPSRILRWLSQHSLEIYLIHQPLLYGILFLVSLTFT